MEFVNKLTVLLGSPYKKQVASVLISLNFALLMTIRLGNASAVRQLIMQLGRENVINIFLHLQVVKKGRCWALENALMPKLTAKRLTFYLVTAKSVSMVTTLTTGVYALLMLYVLLISIASMGSV
jgi:hypothetical protein